MEWPDAWRTVPLWSLFERIKDVGHPEEEMLSVYRDHGVVKKSSRDDNFNKTAENRNIYQLIEEGWLVVNRMKAWQGSVGISPCRGIVSGHYICFRPKHQEDPRFLNWLLRSLPYSFEYARRSRGVRPNQVEIDNDELRVLPVRLPPLEEQRRIADFLDAETRIIDTLVELRRRQASLLTERRQARLSAIAFDLMEAYGSIQFRYLLRSIEQGWSPQCDDRLAEDDEWGVVKSGCVNQGVFRVDQHKALPENIQPRLQYQLRPGDLLMSRASGSVDLIGSVEVVPKLDRKLLLCDKIYRIKVDGRCVSNEFVAHMLRTSAVRDHIKLGISGAEGMANNLPSAVVRSCEIPRAPLGKQGQVVVELERHMKAVDDVQSSLTRQLELLEERRRALITAAVTGELDVTTARGA